MACLAPAAPQWRHVTAGLYGNQQQQQQQEEEKEKEEEKEEEEEEEDARGGSSSAHCPLLAASARDIIK
jgi:hypothetical protein